MAHEPLSALLDGECSAAELDRLLEEMERAPDLKRSYSRQVMAREAAEGTHISRGQACICAGVMARLADEPMTEVSAKVTDLDSRRRWVSFKSLGGLAAAASVAAVAVLVAMPALEQERESAAGSFMPEVSAPANFAPVSAPMTRRSRDLRAVAYTPEQAEQNDELNGFILQHSNSSAEQGVGGTLRYARFAAQTQQSPALTIPEDRR